ncbi:phosphatidate cytidylyltransferase [Flavobacterium cheonhonense]|jgi:phosphatidate cytidylyltransferase|uniref:Phosphatidate cytidylyltransferase n=1 Tax=Flavobacterium cheonhonense TaxID=706185 RepID=A0ABP7T981_9FLAO|nr:phosphatidate cytidylyltransferase [Flavobacterium cheonhonense]PJE41682.1 MAG: phosphatidate cytidylyltransferase [Flavobacterium sp.] [Flavobacterium sp. FEMGT703F]
MTTTVTRALSGAVYVLLLVGATLYSPYSFLLLFGVLLLFSVGEFCKLVGLKPVFPLLLATLGYILFNLDNTVKTNEILLLIAALLVSIRSLVFLFEKKNRFLDKQSKYVFLIGYLIIPIIIFTKIPFISNSYHPEIIIAILILIWTNDTFAYLVGITMGKTKLFERISPKKTIEGFSGGLVFAMIAGVLLAQFYLQESIIRWIIIALLVTTFGTLGDLIESKFKRLAGVKDSGNIMPGHGGFLDRLDSIIFVAPFVYLFYQIIYYVS